MNLLVLFLPGIKCWCFRKNLKYSIWIHADFKVLNLSQQKDNLFCHLVITYTHWTQNSYKSVVVCISKYCILQWPWANVWFPHFLWLTCVFFFKFLIKNCMKLSTTYQIFPWICLPLYLYTNVICPSLLPVSESRIDSLILSNKPI